MFMGVTNNGLVKPYAPTKKIDDKGRDARRLRARQKANATIVNEAHKKAFGPGGPHHGMTLGLGGTPRKLRRDPEYNTPRKGDTQ